jgi:Reverse transcriptase (RNA-dependent DNA polymerase)
VENSNPSQKQTATPISTLTLNPSHPGEPEIQVPETRAPADSPEIGKDTPSRQSDPFNPTQVEAVLKAIKIREGLTPEQVKRVHDLIAEYADCFALSICEVIPAKDATLCLDILEDMELLTKARQQTFTPPQRRYLHKKILEMLDAGIIERTDPAMIKCVSPTTLGQKQHDGAGLTLEQLQQKVNDKCMAVGLTPHFQLPAKCKPQEANEQGERDQKWWVCQDFKEVNKHSKVAPMPQGDIQVKQHRLSGHKYVSVIDFTSGFYTVKIHKESRPYTTFYIKGLGHFWYVHMPFGLMGAPTAFAAVTANHLHDLIADEVMEIFINDGGIATDSFNKMEAKLRRVLDRVRERTLSLSAAKSRLFMEEELFTGS